MIPQQIIDVISGEDALLLPPAQEGVQPMPEEVYALDHLEALVDLGLAVARDTKPTDETATYLLFNPDFFDPEEVRQYAMTDRLAEFVNGEGNNQKPANPTGIVNVFAKDGSDVRDVLVETPEQAQAAIARNQKPGRAVELNPADAGTLQKVINNRVQNVGTVPIPTDNTPR
jgi:hypothetical protein